METNTDNIRQQMRKGFLEYCILSLLEKEDSYPTQLIQGLKGAGMTVVEGTLYPLLIRQKNNGLLSYRWEESPQGPPRKFYSITPKGKAALEEYDQAWKELSDTIATLRNF